MTITRAWDVGRGRHLKMWYQTESLPACLRLLVKHVTDLEAMLTNSYKRGCFGYE